MTTRACQWPSLVPNAVIQFRYHTNITLTQRYHMHTATLYVPSGLPCHIYLYTPALVPADTCNVLHA